MTQKFIEWMEKEKGYGHINIDNELVLYQKLNHLKICYPTIQMMIGYMIEYILTFKPYKPLKIPESGYTTDIRTYYNYLNWYIQEYEK